MVCHFVLILEPRMREVGVAEKQVNVIRSDGDFGRLCGWSRRDIKELKIPL